MSRSGGASAFVPGPRMSHLLITKSSELRELVHRLRDAPRIAFDTEFISEGRYAPQLCLVQIAAGDLLALIDPLAVPELDALWELFCDGRRRIIVHACRSEMEFCHRAIGRMPSKLFDVQLAAGFLGIDYPVAFRTLLDRLLRIDLPKAESRTTWNKRPLEPRQIEYALGDVRHLERMAARLEKKLREKNRFAWYKQEIGDLLQRFRNDFETPRWRNMPKSANMRPRELAILREVWFWRDRTAKKWNIPPGRVLRDDLLVELARRGTSDPKRIASVRGFQRSDLSKILPEIVAAVRKGQDLAPEDLPAISPRISFPQYTVMTQFLFAALGAICKRRHIAQSLLGGPGDVRELIAALLGTLPEEIEPRLRRGWRRGVIGSRLEKILLGKTTLKLDCHRPEDPLIFLNTKNGRTDDLGEASR